MLAIDPSQLFTLPDLECASGSLRNRIAILLHVPTLNKKQKPFSCIHENTSSPSINFLRHLFPDFTIYFVIDAIAKRYRHFEIDAEGVSENHCRDIVVLTSY